MVRRVGRGYNDWYEGEHTRHPAFPLGGVGAGMICLEATGDISHVSLRSRPDVFNEPCTFSALTLRGDDNETRVLAGSVPEYKIFGRNQCGNGVQGNSFGFPRFGSSRMRVRFPLATVELSHEHMPAVSITGWSPFVPSSADDSSLPVAGLEFTFRNTLDRRIDAVYSFNASNFMAVDPPPGGGQTHGTRRIDGGFVFSEIGTAENPWNEGHLAVCVDEPDAKVNAAWFRGGWFDPQSILWRDFQAGVFEDKPAVTEGLPAPGASLFVPFSLEPGEERTVRLMLSWYVPQTNVRFIPPETDRFRDKPVSEQDRHEPWYAGRFDGVDAVAADWRARYDELRSASQAFSSCFYDTTLPPEVVEAVAANLTILKSPTVLRQKDGRLWAFEGCGDGQGCCAGSCTHVWNYAQALPHLLPELERSLRQTEFNESQDEEGHQAFRSALPIQPTHHGMHAAADGQLGGIMKVHRDWKISGDVEWLRGVWPKVKQSLDYCIETWDPEHKGVLAEPHHNTYDIEFWGPDGMCSSFYLGALRAAMLMAEALDDARSLYGELYAAGRAYLEDKLYNGEYFEQEITWHGLRAPDPTDAEIAIPSHATPYSAEAKALLEKEGPKYQYGTGCLADGVLGAWMAEACGVGEILDRAKVESHLLSVHRYNLKQSLVNHVNPQRSGFAIGEDGGLLLCTWPRGSKLSLPFVYSDEVWTGIEYQVASHLFMMGHVEKGREIVRAARDRYDGRVRNPFNEYECGHWYARAMSSYALLQGLSGAQYDAVAKELTLKPAIEGDFRAFLAVEGGYGTVGVKDGKPFIEVASGTIEVKRMGFREWSRRAS